MQQSPNILWICSDQQRFDTLGCYGNNFVHTPNIDRLAAGGMKFEHAYCQSPVCTPSRASFLTGRYPRTTRARQNGQSIPEDEILVTKLLADAGYVCGLAGKLHLSTCDPVVTNQIERRINDGYSVFNWSHHPWAEGPSFNTLANEYNQWLAERGVNYRTVLFGDSKYVAAGMPVESHHSTWCATKAVHFIERGAAYTNPWLFSVNFFDPHAPFDPPVEYLQRYLEMSRDIPLPNYREGELDNKPRGQMYYHRKNQWPYIAMSEEDHRLLRASYWAMIDLIDQQVGRILDALEKSGQMENTMIIYMSDHGEMLGDHGIYLKGPFFYDPAIRVPLIVHGAAVATSGVASAALVELADLAPTLLEWAGLPKHPGMQGKSLTPLLSGESAIHREDIYCEYYNARSDHNEFATMVRTEELKLVVVHGQDIGELYDLRKDPGESFNVWDNPQYASEKIEMMKRLCDRMAWTADPLPLRNGRF